MVHHVLTATCATVHLGGFSPDLAPALVVDSGDTITVETYSGFFVADQAPPGFLTPAFVEICQHLPPERRVDRGFHLLTGPILVRGAQPGDVLEVEILQIYPRLAVGFNAIRPGWGALPERFAAAHLTFIDLDLEHNVAEYPKGSGIRIPLRPMFGILAVCPPQPASSIPPGNHGGNLDNPELTPGSRLYLPVYHPGALFSIGDGHAVQGDGEVCGTAIETSMNGTIRLTLRRDLHLTTPVAETPTHLISSGFAPSLDQACSHALNTLVDLLVERVGLSPVDAYCLCSLSADFRVTQVVNAPQKGIHGMIAKAIFPQGLSLHQAQ
ncbi:MAG: acetamidase/formamidase family protein [Thermostichales cyanobacterium SZTDM-1c_bins_54]